MTQGFGKGRECMAKHCRRIQIESALFVFLLRVGLVVNPDGRKADVHYREQTVGAD
jgi:hypothetical protein